MPGAARTTTDETLAERARAFDHGVFERGVEHVARLDGVTVLTTPSLPTVPHLNTLVVHAALGAEEIESLAGEHLAGLANQRVVIDGEEHGERLREELPARGWTSHRLLHLWRDGAVPPPAAAALAEEVPYGQVRGLREEWLRTTAGLSGEHLDAALAGDARLFAGTPTRAFAVLEAGRPVAYALLLDGGRDGAVEDVYTTPDARGRGLAAAAVAAVLHASRAERHEAVFIPTDADGGAGGLYERLGFAPLCVEHVFSRQVR